MDESFNETIKVYVIRNWEKEFEISQSKRIPDGKPLSYVPMPTKHEGKGLRRLLRSEDALSMFGVWCFVVELAAKMPRRGVLADSDGPFDAEDIADSIGIDPEPVQKLLDLVTGGRINWIELIEWNDELHIPRTNRDSSDNTQSENRAQADEKRREEKRREESTPQTPQGGDAPDLSLSGEESKPQAKRRKKWTRAQLKEERYEAYPNFQAWWKQYPNRKGIRQAFESWVKQGLEFRDQEQLFKVLSAQKKDPQWVKDDGQYIPMGSSYLNKELFDDPLPEKNNGVKLQTRRYSAG